jgi:hypothetical protein
MGIARYGIYLLYLSERGQKARRSIQGAYLLATELTIELLCI